MRADLMSVGTSACSVDVGPLMFGLLVGFERRPGALYSHAKAPYLAANTLEAFVVAHVSSKPFTSAMRTLVSPCVLSIRCSAVVVSPWHSTHPSRCGLKSCPVKLGF